MITIILNENSGCPEIIHVTENTHIRKENNGIYIGEIDLCYMIHGNEANRFLMEFKAIFRQGYNQSNYVFYFTVRE